MCCFLKRVLPFALTLLVGLSLGSLFARHDLKSASQERPSVADNAGGDNRDVFRAREVTQKAQILVRPNPQYTDEARQHQVAGTVVVKAVLSSSGQVTNVEVLSRLPYGLTEQAVDAAQRIEFVPAMKDGRPVSQYVQIEYNFSLY